jgi:hypothetical protein
MGLFLLEEFLEITGWEHLFWLIMVTRIRCHAS